MGMTPRQVYALAHVATDVYDVLDPGLAGTRVHARGLILRSILAVDR